MPLSKLKETLIVFTKPALPGRAKSRLSQEIGVSEALELHKSLLTNISILASKIYTKRKSVNLIAAWAVNSKELQKLPLSDWLPGPFLHTKQNGMSLGDKMISSLGKRLAQGFNTILIGTDIPEIDEQTILDSFDSLLIRNTKEKTNKMVIGPSKDGGFYLIGMNTFNNFIFDGINWDSESTLKRLVENLETKNISCSFMKEKIDIDFSVDIKDIITKYKRNECDLPSGIKSKIEKLNLT